MRLICWGFVMEIFLRLFLLRLNFLPFHLRFRSWGRRGIFWWFWCDLCFSLNHLGLLIWNNIFNIFIIMCILIIELCLLDLLFINLDCILLSLLKTNCLRSWILLNWCLLLKADRFTSIFLNHCS